ncbi:hypothetical protein COO60DRAFT_1008128 [Scenedesmus sp. NREL 46B-D3]|nr:hypothetical protein COO60DRAFT_1008128 [Scenedesmus sp. NREL 46B-D3]
MLKACCMPAQLLTTPFCPPVLLLPIGVSLDRANQRCLCIHTKAVLHLPPAGCAWCVSSLHAVHVVRVVSMLLMHVGPSAGCWAVPCSLAVVLLPGEGPAVLVQLPLKASHRLVKRVIHCMQRKMVITQHQC